MVGNQVGCSWHPVLSKFAKNPDLAYYWMALQATPPINHWNVYMGWTGVDPGTTYDWLPPVGKATVEEYVDGGCNAARRQGVRQRLPGQLLQLPDLRQLPCASPARRR